MTDDKGRDARLRGRLVEGVRLIFVAVLGAAGYQLGAGGYGIAATTVVSGSTRALLFVFLGAACGYVLGGIFGRLTLEAVSGLERELRRQPAAQIAGGIVGLVVGLIVATALSLPLLVLPLAYAWPGAAFIFLVLGSLGLRVGQMKYEDLFGLFGMKPRASGRSAGDLHVIDTSALIDGRIADLVSTGFVSGTVLLHEGVLQELQTIADSSDPKRRSRGRHGLDVLTQIQRAPTVQFQLVEELGVLDVDAALVRLAKESGASLITVDHNLAKVAEALRVPVAQINALAAKFRVPYASGDDVVVQLVKPGREHGQAVGYLDDGTMVVIESADGLIGDEVAATVRNVIQTATGRMIFASLPEPATFAS